MEGKLIVFEGLDASGKETQARKLVDFLNDREMKSIYTDEPTFSNRIGLLIRDWLNHRIDIESGKAITLLYAADRYEHLKKIIVPAVKDGKTVVCDRYYFSTMAYESAIFKIDMNWIKEIHKFVLEPDLVIFLDVEPEECVRRRGEGDKLEKLELLRNVRKIYKKIAEKEGFVTVDGNRTRKEIFENIKKIVCERFGIDC
jgi:dTMP kinase